MVKTNIEVESKDLVLRVLDSEPRRIEFDSESIHLSIKADTWEELYRWVTEFYPGLKQYADREAQERIRARRAAVRAAAQRAKPKAKLKKGEISGEEFLDLLERWDACDEGKDYVKRQLKKGKIPNEIWKTCRVDAFMKWWLESVEGATNGPGCHCPTCDPDNPYNKVKFGTAAEMRRVFPNLPLPEGK